jgi:hypothetical protein
MSYTPSGIAPSGTDYISAVRFLIQDTDATVVELEDAEITALYNCTVALYTTQEQRVYATALDCAKALHRRYAKQATFSSAGTSVQLGARAEYWLNVVQDLAMKLATLSYGGNFFATVGRNANYYDSNGAAIGATQSFTIDRW